MTNKYFMTPTLRCVPTHRPTCDYKTSLRNSGELLDKTEKDFMLIEV